MKVKATWHHVIAVTREIEIDEAAFTAWKNERYGEAADTDLALAAWIETLDTEEIAEVFSDWKTSKPLPRDFELQYSDVIDASANVEIRRQP